MKENERVHNMLMIMDNQVNMYEYRKDGIYIKFGPMKTDNLTKSYKENPDNVLDYLQNIIDNKEVPYKTRFITTEVIKDLKNNN